MSDKVEIKYIDRKNTDCIKWDLVKGPSDALMMWVADLDIETPQPVIDAMIKRVQHHAFGYPAVSPKVTEAVQAWIEKSHGWKVPKEWIVLQSGVCPAVSCAVQEFTIPGDQVIVLSPIYFPLTNIPEDNGRIAVRSSMIWNEKTSKFEIDWADFEAKLALPRARMFILCNPHNPTGRCFSKEELLRIGELCIKHHILIVSDEIHWDFVYPKNDTQGTPLKHISIASLSKEIADITITLSAPSKTFNIPSLQSSFAVVPNQRLRDAFGTAYHRNSLWFESTIAPDAVIAAYTHCYDWVRACDALYMKNAQLLKEQLEQPDMKGLIQVVDAEATFLIGINFNPAIKFFHKKAVEKKGLTETPETFADPTLYPIPRSTDLVSGKPLVPYTLPKAEGDSSEEPVRKLYDRRVSHALTDFVFSKTAVYCNDGVGFGTDYDGWIRMNVGCPTENVLEATKRIRKLITDLLAEYS